MALGMSTQKRMAQRHHARQDVATGIHAAPGRTGAAAAPERAAARVQANAERETPEYMCA